MSLSVSRLDKPSSHVYVRVYVCACVRVCVTIFLGECATSLCLRMFRHGITSPLHPSILNMSLSVCQSLYLSTLSVTELQRYWYLVDYVVLLRSIYVVIRIFNLMSKKSIVYRNNLHIFVSVKQTS